MKLESNKWDLVFLVAATILLILLNSFEATQSLVGKGALILVYVAYLIGRIVGQSKEEDAR